MAYLIDTDYVIDHVTGAPRMVHVLQDLRAEGTAISIITYMEVVSGLELRPVSRDDRGRFEALLEEAPVLPLTIAVAERYGRVTADLHRRGRRVRSRVLDLIIAATALEHDLTLVTRNVDDYRDVPGLKLHTPV